MSPTVRPSPTAARFATACSPSRWWSCSASWPQARDDGPWLAVASFVNPHDIAFSGFGWEQMLKFGPPDDTVPDIPEPPSQSDSVRRSARPARRRSRPSGRR